MVARLFRDLTENTILEEQLQQRWRTRRTDHRLHRQPESQFQAIYLEEKGRRDSRQDQPRASINE